MMFIFLVVIGILYFFYFFLNRKKSAIKKEVVTSSPNFISSDKFNGAKQEYVFKNCEKGLGYYKDIMH